MKREFSSDGGQPGKHPRVHFEYVFKILAQNPFVGAILGKGGATITALHAETGCEISAARKDDCFPDTKFRIVHVSADCKEKLRNGIGRICQLLPDLAKTATNNEVKLDCMGNDENEIRLRFLIPQNLCGSIIGKKGDMIKDLRTRSGAKFDIYRDAQNYGPIPENMCEVVGQYHQIDEVLNVVTDALELEKDAAWFQIWAGHKDCRSGGGHERRGREGRDQGLGHRDNDDHRDNRSQYRERDRSEREHRGRSGEDDRGDRHSGSKRQRSSRGNDGRQRHDPANVLRDEIDRMNNLPDLGMEVEVNTRIPSALAGCIIGTAGNVIKKLKEVSGADIKVHQATENYDRDVEFKGGPMEVCAALLMCWSRLQEKAGAALPEANTEEGVLQSQMQDLQRKLEAVRATQGRR